MLCRAAAPPAGSIRCRALRILRTAEVVCRPAARFFTLPAGGRTPHQHQEQQEGQHQEDAPTLTAEAAEVERRRARKMAMDPDDAPPEWTDAIRRFSYAVSSTTIRLDDVGHSVGEAGDIKPTGHGLTKTSRKLPKLRSLRETATEEERSGGKLTAAVLEKILDARPDTNGEYGVRHHDLAQRFDLAPPVLEAILRHHDTLPDYKMKLRDLADLAK